MTKRPDRPSIPPIHPQPDGEETIFELPGDIDSPWLFVRGDRVDRYTILEELGRGGMSQVYKVIHQKTEQISALKVMSLTNSKLEERLLREARMMARLNIENVVAIRDAFSIRVVPRDGTRDRSIERFGVVMELVEGGDLTQQDPAFIHDNAMEIFKGVVIGVRSFHKKGIIHRDLKPANVLLEIRADGSPCPKLVDFGIARDEKVRGLTQMNARMGTPDYMAPEQFAAAENAGIHADIYALGCILYWMHCGRPPFYHLQEAAIRAAKDAESYEIPASVPDLVRRIVKRCLSVRPQDRFDDCDELLEYLAPVPVRLPVLSGEPVGHSYDIEPDPRIDMMARGADPLVVYDTITQWMAPFLDHCQSHDRSPYDHPRYLGLRQRQALALARAGATRQAQDILMALHKDPRGNDSETLGILARTWKDRAFQTKSFILRQKYLYLALQGYLDGHEGARLKGNAEGTFYTGINAATCCFLVGAHARSAEIALDVLHFCEATPLGGYHRLATMGEAQLLLGDHEQAFKHLEEAMASTSGNYVEIAATRLQWSRIIRAARPGPDAASPDRMARLEAVLPIPPIVAYLGRGPGPTPWTPGLATGLDEFFIRHPKVIAYTAAATEEDLLFLRSLVGHAAETNVYLPFQKDLLLRESASDERPSGWTQSLDQALQGVQSPSELVINHHIALNPRSRRTLPNLRSFTRLCVYGAALQRSRELGTRFLAIDQNGQPVERRALLQGRPDAVPNHHEYRVFLFADMFHYSQMDEPQMLSFAEDFLRNVERIVSGLREDIKLTRSAGDGFFLVFEDLTSALKVAMEIRDFAEIVEGVYHGLPEKVQLRIALHAGPCYSYKDPLTGALDFCGFHVVTAARLEPVTPAGEVYATLQFMALCTALGVEGFRFEYVGQIPLPKDSGVVPAFHVRREIG